MLSPVGAFAPIYRKEIVDLGFPWFELACFYLPILFIVVAYWVIKIVYQDIDLEHQPESKEAQK